ncbi:MAG: DAHL domain-containing protein [Candidatus Competibacteraceae bacterium]
MRSRWPSVSIIAGLLLLLTYFLFQSESPDLVLRARLNQALDAFELHDTTLDRDVLLVRAGLLTYYDSLAVASRDVLRAATDLQRGIQTASAEAARLLGPQADALAEAARQKKTVVEYFKSDNALLRNSLAYVVQAAQALRAKATVAEEQTVAAEVSALTTLLLRFIQRPEPELGKTIETLLGRLPDIPQFQPDLQTLAAHGRLIVQVLPRVDTELRQVTQGPAMVQARSLRDAMMRHYGRAETHAQIFRVLLYAAAVMLLGYLGYLFARLQRNARVLHQVNEDLRREMAEHQRAETALRTSEERLCAITESAWEAIISIDDVGRVVSWNAGATAMFGYAPEEALSAPFAGLMAAPHQEAYARIRTAGAIDDNCRLGGVTTELNGVRKNGEEFPLEMSLSSWHTAQGAFVTGIIRDLTERKHLEEKTRQQELQLIQASKMTALGTLVSGVAHEINNPNQLVLLNARLLADVWSDAAAILDDYAREQGAFLLGGLPYQEMQTTVPALIDDLRDSALRIESIVGDLKDFARPGGQGARIEFSLNDAARRAARLLAHPINKKTARFQIDLADDVPPVKGNPQQIEQVIVNLLGNALEALPDASRGIFVSTRWRADECCVVLDVRDEGTGIAPEHLARLCDPFFTTKSGSGGTGLGLAISSELVRAHGGRLIFESEWGRGTLARVELPPAAAVPPVRPPAPE